MKILIVQVLGAGNAPKFKGPVNSLSLSLPYWLPLILAIKGVVNLFFLL
jgi:hypothetical protein